MQLAKAVYSHLAHTHLKVTYIAGAATLVGAVYLNSKARDELLANSALIILGIATQLLANSTNKDMFYGYGKKMLNDISSKLSFISTYVMIGNWVVASMEKNYSLIFCKGMGSVVGRFFASHVLFEKNKEFNPDMKNSDRLGQVFRIVAPLTVQEIIRLYNPEGSFFSASTALNCGIYLVTRAIGDVIADANFDVAKLNESIKKRATRPAFYLAEYYTSKSLFLIYGNPELKDSLFFSNFIASGYRAAYEILFIVPLIAEPITNKILDLVSKLSKSNESKGIKID